MTDFVSIPYGHRGGKQGEDEPAPPQRSVRKRWPTLLTDVERLASRSVPDTRCGVLAVRASYCLGAETSVRRSCARIATQTPTAAACFLEPQLMLQDTAMGSIRRVLVNISELRRVPVDPEDVYFLEAVGGETLVRLRSKRPLRDVRPLGTLLEEFTPYGFLRVHRNHAVNLARIEEIRRRYGRDDWEVKLEPSVNREI